MRLGLVSPLLEASPSLDVRLRDHEALLQGYLDTHDTRNHASGTRHHEERFLRRWFEAHGDGRPLFLWEAMAPVTGRARIVAYSKMLLLEKHRAGSTVGGHLGSLRRLFEYVLAWPYLPDAGGNTIQMRYGAIDQPVLVYDYPHHVWGGRREDAPLTRVELHGFYDFVRGRIAGARKPRTAARAYTMIVVAAESGLRLGELVQLEVQRDLLFDSNRIQTRFGKASAGSGPRVRQTIFTPFAQRTVEHYLSTARRHFRRWSHAPSLFLSETGGLVDPSNASTALRSLAKDARAGGLRTPPRFGWHSLRRSFATIYSEEYPGRDHTLVEMLGHENLSSLHRYLHHTRAYHEQVMDGVLDSLLPT